MRAFIGSSRDEIALPKRNRKSNNMDEYFLQQLFLTYFIISGTYTCIGHGLRFQSKEAEHGSSALDDAGRGARGVGQRAFGAWSPDSNRWALFDWATGKKGVNFDRCKYRYGFKKEKN